MKEKITREAVQELRSQGLKAIEIAERFGVSRARVYQLSRQDRYYRFKPFREDQLIYPNWRNWMNENQVTARQFLILMGIDASQSSYNALWCWMNGRCYPTKRSIDKILQATGLTYEQLFATEEPA